MLQFRYYIVALESKGFVMKQDLAFEERLM